jgi:hypothetical protein
MIHCFNWYFLRTLQKIGISIMNRNLSKGRTGKTGRKPSVKTGAKQERPQRGGRRTAEGKKSDST